MRFSVIIGGGLQDIESRLAGITICNEGESPDLTTADQLTPKLASMHLYQFHKDDLVSCPHSTMHGAEQQRGLYQMPAACLPLLRGSHCRPLKVVIAYPGKCTWQMHNTKKGPGRDKLELCAEIHIGSRPHLSVGHLLPSTFSNNGVVAFNISTVGVKPWIADL